MSTSRSSPSPPSTATTSCTGPNDTSWYDGPTLLEYLESVELSAPHPETDKLRLPVQWVSRPTAEQRAATPADSPPGH